MKPSHRLLVAVAVNAVLACIGWNIVQATRADAIAPKVATAALRINPTHPQALALVSRQALQRGELEQASELASKSLAIAPGRTDAYATVALAGAQGGKENADALLAIAARRARRDSHVRAAAVAAALRVGDLPVAMAHLDALLRVGSRNGGEIFAAMAQQAADADFAAVLVQTLAANPPPRWRDRFLAALGRSGDAEAVDLVYAGLQETGDLSTPAVRQWLDRMMHDGRWGEAYAHWIGTLGPIDGGISTVFNGNFESPVTDLGFDWRRQRAQGVYTEAVDDPAGVAGRVAHLHFVGRPTAIGDLAHPLLLGEGRYRLSLRARGEYLRSDEGLRMRVRCTGRKGAPLAELELPGDSFAWREVSTEFEVPGADCPGQWLRLENPAVQGAAQQVSGDLWMDDVRIVPEAIRGEAPHG